MSVFRRDLWSVLTVLAVMMMVASVFPYESLRFRARQQAPQPASVAFVTLTAAEEAAAMRAAKTAWQVDPSGFRRLRIALAVGDLPEYPNGSVVPRPLPVSRDESEVFPYEPAAYPATRGASPPPPPVAAEPPAHVLPFPREELLKIN